jgi:putative hydrolase of the HAD superfamily
LLSHLVFDLDQTIYPRHSGLMQAIGDRIMQYMIERMGMDPEIVPGLRHRYWKQYGTTSRGLATRHELDVDEYMEYVHDVPLHAYIGPDPELDAVLGGLPQRKVIFTNATAAHAHAVLDVMQLAHHFEGVYDVYFCGNEGKPAPKAYLRLLDALDVRAEHCLLVEDSVANLVPAQSLGMTTVLVDPPADVELTGVDYVIQRVADIAGVVRELTSGSGSGKSR